MIPWAERLVPIDCESRIERVVVYARGAVVTMGSDAGVRGLRGGWAAYCAAKGGVVTLTRQLAIDLAPEVRVNCGLEILRLQFFTAEEVRHLASLLAAHGP